MSNKHTPGPWVIEHLDWAQKGYVFINAKDHDAIAQVVWLMEDDEKMGRNSPTEEANARLIAAAPDLLQALIDAVDLIETVSPFEGDTLRNARAAIAKATGGST